MAGTRTTRTTAVLGTDNEEGQGTKGPQDASDILGVESEIGGGTGRNPPRRSPMGGVDPNKGIDLSKKPNLDLEKPGPPRRGIGIDINKSEAGNLGIGVEVPIPVPAPISARGKVAIDPATGKIRGGGLGLGLGKGPIGISLDIGVDTPPGSDKFGCFKYVTVSVGPFQHTFGKNECEPKPTAIPTPTPINSEDKGFGPDPSTWPPFKPNCNYQMCTVYMSNESTHENCLGYASGDGSFGYSFKRRYAINSYSQIITGVTYNPNYRVWTATVKDKIILGSVFSRQSSWIYIVKGNLLKGQSQSPNGGDGVALGESIDSTGGYLSYTLYGSGSTNWVEKFQEKLDWINGGRKDYTSYKFIPLESCPGGTPDTPIFNQQPISSPTPTAPPINSNPPVLNPPPRKKMDENCCKRLEILQLETLRMLGRRVVNGKLAPVTNVKGFLGEEIERVKTPIQDARKPEKVKIKFATLYEMLMYEFKQAIDLDTALDPKSYKIPTGYLQNPEYSRDSEHSLKDNNQPDRDKSRNKRELEIHEDKGAIFSGFIQQQSYIFEAIKRLEYLFPFGELSDAKIAKDLLIPGQTGDIKIHNIIMLYELQIQYLNATLGNPREVLTVKDANPAIAGDQPIEVKALTLADWMRQIIKFQVDTGGDLDAAINLMVRDFRTNLANRTDIIKTAEMTQALFEDSGMREQQEYIQVHLEGDPYAGQWVKGKGFEPNPELEKKTEEATEKVLRETMNPTNIKLKVSRRHKDEKTDMRDLFRGLADFVQRLLSIPSAGDAAKSIDKLIESAKFKVQTEAALLRQNIVKAATASRNRTKKRKK